jgi:hypothetical protein
MENKEIIAYKGFNADLTCQGGFQYEVGQDYEMDGEPSLCEKGFHACTMPLDVFSYYSPGSSRYAEVSLSGTVKTNEDFPNFDSKTVGTKIHIDTELSLSQMIREAENYIAAHSSYRPLCTESAGICSDESNHTYFVAETNAYRAVAICREPYSMAVSQFHDSTSLTTSRGSVASAFGYSSAAVCIENESCAKAYGNNNLAATLGSRSIAEACGQRAAAVCVAHSSAALATGYRSLAATTDNYSRAQNYGPSSIALALGAQSTAEHDGVNGIAIATGYCSSAEVNKFGGIAIATGVDSMAAGALDSWLVLVERSDSAPITSSDIKLVRAFKVDGKTIKPNTFYFLHNGEPVEAKH